MSSKVEFLRFYITAAVNAFLFYDTFAVVMSRFLVTKFYLIIAVVLNLVAL